MPVPNVPRRSLRPHVTVLLLLALMVLQVLYLAEHADWALSHPVKGAHWDTLAGHGTEHPSDYLPGGYATQNRDAILMFLLAAVLLPTLLRRLDLLRFQAVTLTMVICLAVFFAIAILYSEQRYFAGIDDVRRETAVVIELIRVPMTTVPKGHCRERLGLRLETDSGRWLMHLKCDTGLAYSMTREPPRPGTRYRIETGRDDRGNRVLLSLASP